MVAAQAEAQDAGQEAAEALARAPTLVLSMRPVTTRAHSGPFVVSMKSTCAREPALANLLPTSTKLAMKMSAAAALGAVMILSRAKGAAPGGAAARLAGCMHPRCAQQPCAAGEPREGRPGCHCAAVKLGPNDAACCQPGQGEGGRPTPRYAQAGEGGAAKQGERCAALHAPGDCDRDPIAQPYPFNCAFVVRPAAWPRGAAAANWCPAQPPATTDWQPIGTPS